MDMKIWVLSRKPDCYGNIRFLEEAEKAEIELEIINPEEFDIIVTKEGRKSILRNGNHVSLPDCLIPRMGAATTYFALAVIRHMERLGVLVLNSSQSIELARDKLAHLQALSVSNISIPKTMLAKFPLCMESLEREFEYPLVLKTIAGAEGKGVFLCESRDQMTDLAEFVEHSKDPNVNVILQEFIKTSRGRDVRVWLLGGRAIGAMLRTAKEGKFKANFSLGGDVAPYEMNPTVEWLAVESARLIGLDIAGVDILFDGDGFKVCEVNSSPGYEGFEKATDINIPREVFNYINIRLGETGG